MRSRMNSDFKEQIIFRLEENVPRIKKCLELISEEELWKKPNSNLNSIGNLIIHLRGNITQYVMSSLGNKPDKRHRNQEFGTPEMMDLSDYSKASLIQIFEKTISDAVQTIKNLSNHELNRLRLVQGFELTGIGILIHVCEHLSYHVGQISLLTKLYVNKDLGYYDGQNLNEKNRN